MGVRSGKVVLAAGRIYPFSTQSSEFRRYKFAVLTKAQEQDAHSQLITPPKYSEYPLPPHSSGVSCYTDIAVCNTPWK